MAFRSNAALILLLDGLREIGEDVTPVLRRFGLDADRLDPTAVIDRDLERRVNEAIAGSLRDPLAGLKVGSNLGVGSYGPFTLLLLTAENALAAVRAALEFEALTFLSGALAFEPARDRSALLLRPDALPEPALRFRVDLDVAGTCRLMHDLRQTARAEVLPQRVVMPYARPPEAATYAATFGCRIDWGGREVRIEFANDALQRPFVTADRSAHEVLRAHCRRALADLDVHSAGLTSRVRSHVSACSGTLPRIAEAAALLGVSERSLRRALRADGTSFRAIVDDVRLRKARQLLRDARWSIADVAQQLGYSEPASFIHAFKRWTGVPPAVFRRSARSGSGR